MVQVKEQPEYLARTYILPDFLRLLYLHKQVEGEAADAFMDLEGESQAPSLLAQSLFAVDGALTVRMEKNQFTVTFTSGSNGPEVDRQVILALKETLVATLTFGVEWLDLFVEG